MTFVDGAGWRRKEEAGGGWGGHTAHVQARYWSSNGEAGAAWRFRMKARGMEEWQDMRLDSQVGATMDMQVDLSSSCPSFQEHLPPTPNIC